MMWLTHVQGERDALMIVLSFTSFVVCFIEWHCMYVVVVCDGHVVGGV